MLLDVIHITRYTYVQPASNAKHIAYLRPLDLPHQKVLAHSLGIFPQPAVVEVAQDVYGNSRTYFSLVEPHNLLNVQAKSTVSTWPARTAFSDEAWHTTWESVQAHFSYHAKAVYDSATEFVFASPCVPRHEAFLQYAKASFRPGMAYLASAEDLMHRIHSDFTYEADSTDVNTPVLQAFEQRRGVCQDFAHIMVACFRALGLPARYISGYLLTQPPPGQPRLIGADASHAWASVYLPFKDERTGKATGQWVDFDPTNNRQPGEDYITLATGRDFADVSPLRGVIQGGANHTLEVEVTVIPGSEA